MEKLKFTKLSATGNDFILLDSGLNARIDDIQILTRRICRRRTSVGADGLLYIEPHPQYDFRLRYINADGSETECGNGARAAAFYAVAKSRIASKTKFLFGQTEYEAEVNQANVKLLMGEAHEHDMSPGILEDPEFDEGGFVNTGVPHYVLFSTDVEKVDVRDRGSYYRHHIRFQPAGSNVDFVQIISDSEVVIRTFERGVEAETLSCGTGCVAAAIVANQNRSIQLPMKLHPAGGVLTVSAHPDGRRYYLEGEVKPVYSGTLI